MRDSTPDQSAFDLDHVEAAMSLVVDDPWTEERRYRVRQELLERSRTRKLTR